MTKDEAMKSGLVTLMTLMAFAPNYSYHDTKIKTKRDERPCLNCGATHSNNNSFCSRECCLEYRTKKEATNG